MDKWIALLRRFFYLYFLGMLVCNPLPVQANDDDPAQEFQGFNLQGYTTDGEKSWDVQGETANIHGQEIEMTNVIANSYGDRQMKVTADTGRIDQINERFQLREDVIITNDDGSQLLTESLDWDRQEDLVTTEDDVLITNERMTVTGKGMEAKPGLATTQIQENVTVIVDTEDDVTQPSIVTITSDGPMTIDQNKSMATFEDNVEAVQDDQVMKADRMEIYFSKDMNSILQIICLGHVMIERGENKTFAEKARYNALTKKLILSGRPKLIFDTEEEMEF